MILGWTYSYTRILRVSNSAQNSKSLKFVEYHDIACTKRILLGFIIFQWSLALVLPTYFHHFILFIFFLRLIHKHNAGKI